MDKREGKKPCKDASTTTVNNNGKATSSRTAAQVSDEPPRDRRNLEAIRKKRKEEKDAQEQEQIKRRQQRYARSTEGESGESSKEQDELERAIAQSLLISRTRQLHLDGSPGSSGSSKTLASQATVQKAMPPETEAETTLVAARATIRPLNTVDQQRLDGIRGRLESPAHQPQSQPSSASPSNAADVPTASACSRNLQGTQDQLVAYQRRQRELQQRRQIPAQATYRPGDTSLSTGPASTRSKRAPNDSHLSKSPVTVRSKPPDGRATRAAGPQTTLSPTTADTIMKPGPANSSPFSDTVVNPRATASCAIDSMIKTGMTSNPARPAAATNTRALSSNAQVTLPSPQAPLSSLPSLAPPRSAAKTYDTTSFSRATQLGDSAGSRPQPATQRTVLTGNMSQALTRILVPVSAENSTVRRPDAMPSLASVVEEAPRVPGGLPELASQAIAAQAQGTAVYPGINAGGAIRQAAESRGASAVTQFETVLRSNLLRLCPAGFQWLNTYGGYICAGGHHFVLHASIDMWANGTLMLPGMHTAHRLSRFERTALSVHPPPVAMGLGLHHAHRMFMMQLASVGAVADDAGLCPCIRELGFSVKTPAEVEALEGIVVTLRKVFPDTGLCFYA